MELTLEKLNTALWIGLAICILITWLVRKAQMGNWRNGVDVRVTGAVPYRSQEVRNKDIWYEGAIYILFVIDVLFAVAAMFTIPSF